MARKRVLLSAFVCSPARGSEPGIGWNIASRLGQYHDVTILCSSRLADENYRAEIEDHLKSHPQPGITIHFVDPPFLSRLLQRPLISFAAPLFFVGYAAWQRKALAEARKLHAQRPFDITHHLTITGFREPGYLWKLKVPFVWGPIAGASNIPWPFFKTFSLRDRLFYTLKNTINELQKRFKSRPRRAAHAAKKILATSEEDRRMAKRHWHADSDLMLDTGTPDLAPSSPSPCTPFFPSPGTPGEGQGGGPSPALLSTAQPPRATRPLQLIWSGLHIGRKALPLALHALSRLNDPATRQKWTLKILGSGRETENWKRLADQLKISDRLTWLGHLPRAEALSQMRSSDIFLFTSLQEGTSTVVMEALALGLPVICHNACGMSVAVTDSSGIKIPLKDPQTSITNFAAAIQSLLSNSPQIQAMSIGALTRAQELTWDKKAQAIAEIYDALPSPV